MGWLLLVLAAIAAAFMSGDAKAWWWIIGIVAALALLPPWGIPVAIAVFFVAELVSRTRIRRKPLDT